MLMGYLRKVKDLSKPQAMNQSNLLHAVDDFVFSLFLAEPKPELLYHDYKHTADVVEGVIKLAAAHELSAADTEILALAAWFHDTGFLQQSAGHEVISVSIAKKYLASQNCNEATIDLVAACIEATALGYTPKTLLQQIIKDADMLAVGTEDYFITSELLREEKRLLNGIEIDEIEWLKGEIEFLKSHTYYTKVAQLNYNHVKSKNLLKRQNEVEKLMLKQIESYTKKEKVKATKSSSEVPGRGIETMFRVTLKNHISISAIADNKANILLTINALIISISVSALIPNYQVYKSLLLPTGFLLLVCLTTIICATLSTSPKITKGTFKKQDVQSKNANLLLF